VEEDKADGRIGNAPMYLLDPFRSPERVRRHDVARDTGEGINAMSAMIMAPPAGLWPR
jgi:hypothetical protein